MNDFEDNIKKSSKVIVTLEISVLLEYFSLNVCEMPLGDISYKH
jgi:hypothetical protein